MINKKIHAEMIARRDKPEPDVQQRLRQALQSELGGQAKILPNHSWTEYGLTIGCDRAQSLEIFTKLKNGAPFQFNMLIDVTCVDWLDSRSHRFEIVYQLLSLTHQHRLCVKVEVPEETPSIDSVLSLWPAANFLEREVWDMYGVTFAGHGDLRRILMYDEFVGHPLRKDYPILGKQPRVPLRVPELRNTSADMIRDELVAMPKPRTSGAKTAGDEEFRFGAFGTKLGGGSHG